MSKMIEVKIGRTKYEFPKEIMDELIKAYPRRDPVTEFRKFLKTKDKFRVEMKYGALYVHIPPNNLELILDATQAASEFAKAQRAIGGKADVTMSSGYLKVDI